MDFSSQSILGFAKGANPFRARVNVHDGVVLLRIDGARTVASVVDGAPLPASEVNDVLSRFLATGFLVVVGEGAGAAADADAGAVAGAEADAGAGESVRMPVDLTAELEERLWNEKPLLKVGIDITTRDLTMAQGFFVSRVDGATPVKALAQLCGVNRKAAIATVVLLALDGVVTLSADVAEELRQLVGDVESDDLLTLSAAAEPQDVDDDVPRIELARTWRKVKPEGNVRETPFAAVLRFAMDAKQTGVIRVDSAAGRREVFLQEGVVVCAATSAVEDDIGLLLRQAERFNARDYDRYKSLVARSAGGPIGVLVEMGIVKAEDAGLLLRFRDEKVLEKLLLHSNDVKGGTYEFVAKRRLPLGLSVTEPSTPAVLWRTMLDATLEESTRRFATEYIDHFFFAATSPKFPIAALRLRKKDKDFLDLLTEIPRRLREYYVVSGANRLRTALYVQTFFELGVLEASKNPPDILTKALTPRRFLEEKLARSVGRNHFELLEVQEVATKEEIESAFARLKQDFKEAKFDESDRENSRKLNSLIDLAARVLIDDDARRAYREQVCGRERLQMLAAAEFQKGEDFLFFRKRYASALACFQTAHELAPWDHEYLASLGVALFKSSFPDNVGVQNAMKLIDRALSLAPDSARVQVCLAIVNAETGNKHLARQLLDRAAACKKRSPGVMDLIASLKREI